MDGMNWFRGNQFEMLAQQKAERKALRNALLLTGATILLSLVFVLSLTAAGVMLPAVEEFSSPQVETVD